MKRKGFTLVELLAVIVILAIILAIAIPSITNVVNSSRLSSFAVSSKMLERAAKTYLSVNNTAVASGSTSYILYSDMKTAGYINKVVDPQSKNECTNSGVYVTNNSGTYTYKGALACDNYMDIDSYNLITNSDFSNGTTGWTIANSVLSVNNNIMSITADGGNTMARAIQDLGIKPSNHKVYLRIKTRVTSSLCTQMYVMLRDGAAGTLYDQQIVNTPIANNYYTISGLATIGSLTNSLNFYLHHQYTDAATASGKVMEVSGAIGAYVFDLTAIYGAGNEPTATQMDNIMTNMGK